MERKEIPGSSEFRQSVEAKCGGKCLTVAEYTHFDGVVQHCSILYLLNRGSSTRECVASGSQENIRQTQGPQKYTEPDVCPWRGGKGWSEETINTYNGYVKMGLPSEHYKIIYPKED